jgi:hypothetical protein
MGIYPPCPLPISTTDSAEERAKWDVQLTDSPVGSILFSRLWGEGHVGDVSETRIKQET